MTGRRWLTASLLSLGLLAGCRSKDTVRVRLTFDAPAGTRPLENDTVFAGANKTSWTTNAAGESVQVALPPEGEPPDVLLTYKAGPAPRLWRGPSIPRGVGYAIGIHIAPDGSVTDRHCQSPCDLP